MENRVEHLLLETDRHRIRGKLTLARDGYRSRISDMLNASERDFIALTDVTIDPLDGGEQLTCEFLAVARSKIVFAMPLIDSSAPLRTIGVTPTPQPA
jgi:hypothetical protein